MAVRSNAELNYFRIRATATPTTHNILGSIPNKGCFPLPSTVAGITITSDPASSGTENKKVVFGSADFIAAGIQEGDYLYAADVVRKIVNVSAKQLLLEYPLPASVSTADLKISKPGKYRRMIARNVGSGTPILQEAIMSASSVVENFNEMGLAPFSYDVSTASMEITFELSE